MTKLLLALCLFTGLLTDWQTYTNAINGFTINYPPTWTQTSNVNAIAFLSPKESPDDPFQENVNLMIQDLSSHPMTLAEYTAFSKEQVQQQLGDSAIISVGDLVFAGQPAKEWLFNMEYGGHKLKVKQYWFMKDNAAYLFTYTALPEQFDLYHDTAMKVIHSFTFYMP